MKNASLRSSCHLRVSQPVALDDAAARRHFGMHDDSTSSNDYCSLSASYVHTPLLMSQTLQRVGSSARLTLSRGSSLHGGSSGGSTHNGSNAALLLLNQAGSVSSPRTLTLSAGEGAPRQRRGVLRDTKDQV